MTKDRIRMLPRNGPWLAILLLGLAVACPARAEDSAERQPADGVAFFEAKIRPVLVEKCYSCHSQGAEELQGGLLLDSREGVLEGGDSGPAVVPGNPAESLLLQALKYEAYEMPPDGAVAGGGHRGLRALDRDGDARSAHG